METIKLTKIAKNPSQRNCSVMSCKNTKRKDPNLKFYSFPNRPWEKERKMQWIKAVDRKMPDGTPWVPSKCSQICSAHFCGGSKSNHPHNEAYNPTILLYPLQKKKHSNKTEQQLEEIEFKDVTLLDMDDPKQYPATADCKHIDTQTDTIFNENVTFDFDIPSILFCWQDSSTNEASTQTSIVLRMRNEIKKEPMC